jgi:ribulose-5-phosphate 4-epimerase/fuculose-1-phosphate aldolase
MMVLVVHAARPDVVCAAHTHSIYGRTFSTLGIPLPITSQDGCAFYNVRHHKSLLLSLFA